MIIRPFQFVRFISLVRLYVYVYVDVIPSLLCYYNFLYFPIEYCIYTYMNTSLRSVNYSNLGIGKGIWEGIGKWRAEVCLGVLGRRENKGEVVKRKEGGGRG